MKLSSKQVSVVCTILTLCLAGIGGFRWLDRRRTESHGESHGSARTRMDIQNIALAIKIYVQETGSLPDALTSGLKEGVNTRHLYASLFGDHTGKLDIGPAAQHWKDSNDLVDRWNHAFNIVVRTNVDASFEIRIWSDGPNRKSEAGTGDDITSDTLRVEVDAERP